MTNPFATPAPTGKATPKMPIPTQPALFPDLDTNPPPSPQPWVLEAAETHNPVRTSTKATLATCHTCHAHTFTAIDSWTETQTATIDPTNLTPAQELQALRAGRQTYKLHPSRWAAPTIHQRTHWTIQAKRSRPFVTPTHKCGKPLGQPIPWNAIYQPGKGPHHDNQPAPF